MTEALATLGLVDLHRAGVGPREVHRLAILALRLGEAERRLVMATAADEALDDPTYLHRIMAHGRIEVARDRRDRLLGDLTALHYDYCGPLDGRP